MISTPIIVVCDTVDFFDSVEDAESYLEPWAVTEEGAVAYDGEGRLLELRVVKKEFPGILGLGKTVAEAVEIECADDEPAHAPELRAILSDFLERHAASERDLDEATLHTLVEQGVRFAGTTR